MSKKDEKIIISKRLATDLIWWLEHASAPCMTIGEVYKHWHQFKDTQLTLARDSMKDELEKALVAKKDTKQVWLTIEEAKELYDGYVQVCEIAYLDTKPHRMLKKLLKLIEKAEKKDE